MSAPTPGFGAPSLGPADRIPDPPRPAYDLAWDSITPAAWRAFGEPANTRKEDPVSYDPKYAGNYNPRPEPQPTPQPAPEQKPEASK